MNVRVGAKCLWLRRNDDFAPKLFFVMGMDYSIQDHGLCCVHAPLICAFGMSLEVFYRGVSSERKGPRQYSGLRLALALARY